jgi:hypothetical protein
MTTKAVEQELLELEKQYWQAMKDKDADTAMRLSDDPCLIAGPVGIMRIDRQALKGMLKAASYTLNNFSIGDAQVQMLGDEIAVVAYNVHEELTVEGKPVSLDAADASTWVRRNGRWVCALHAESLKGDPFGEIGRREANSSTFTITWPSRQNR